VLNLNGLAASFDRWFFAPADGRDLNLFRVLYCGALACVHMHEIIRVEKFYANYFSVYFPTPLFEWFGLGQLPLGIVRLSGIVLLAALACAAGGLYTRWALTLSWVSFFFFYGTVLGFEKPEPNALSRYTYHYNNIVLFILVILSVSPGISRWGVDAYFRSGYAKLRTSGVRWPDGYRPEEPPPGREPAGEAVPVWPTRLIKLTLALAYFGAGYTKLQTSGVKWADGYTLQAYFLQKYLGEGVWAGYWLAQYYWVCVVFSLGTLALELSFIVVPFLGNRHPLTWMYVVAGLGFHAGIAVTMNIIEFLPFMCLAYLIFLDWSLFRRLIKPVYPRPVAGYESTSPIRTPPPFPAESHPVRQPWELRLSRCFIIALLTTLLSCIALNVEAWPFTDYGVFPERAHYSKIRARQIRAIDSANDVYWLRGKELGSGTISLVRFYLAQVGRTSPERLADWRASFVHEGPDVLRHFHRHLPPPLRERFHTLEFVTRSVRMDVDGWLVPSDTVLFSTETRPRQ
jgi:hypothetical protein